MVRQAPMELSRITPPYPEEALQALSRRCSQYFLLFQANHATAKVDIESWPIAGTFTISRGSRTEARVVVATMDDGAHRGRGECVPYPRYGETVEGVAATIESFADVIAGGDLTRGDPEGSSGGGRAQCTRLCALGLGGEGFGETRLGTGWRAGTRARNHSLHAEPRHTGGDGSGGTGSKPQATLESEAWRRWRPGADCRRPPRRAAIDTDRGRQRGMEQSKSSRRTWRRAALQASR